MRIPILCAALVLVTAPVGAQSTAPQAIQPETVSALPAGTLEVRFGAEVPVLGCDSLRVCRVELQAGERFRLAPAIGDSERWLTLHDDQGAVPVVIVKPTTCGIATNLMVFTDRRSYDVDLEAGPCRGAAGENPVRVVRFTYPDEPDGLEGRSYTSARSGHEERVLTLAERAALAANADYRWSRRGGFPWSPERVADDGEHVYIEVPDAARYSAAPVLYSLGSGDRALLNYATEGDLFVTDRVFSRAVLVIGDAALEIERKAPRQGPTLNRKEISAVSAFVGLVAALLLGR